MIDLPNDWSEIDDPEFAQRLCEELAREVPPSHILAGGELKAMATSDRTDDLLFARTDGVGVFLVHLTWNEETDSAWPYTVHYSTVAEFAEAWVTAKGI